MAKRGAAPTEHRDPPTWWQGVAEAFGIGRRRRARRRARRSTLPSQYAPLGRSSRRRPPHGQARRDGNYRAYLVGFGVIIVMLAAFLYVGLSWATGTGRTAAMVPAAPAATAPPPATTGPATDAAPTASRPAEQTYLVKAGDTPVAIAQRFKVKVEDLLAANNVTDPRSLQVGQLLKIPQPASQ